MNIINQGDMIKANNTMVIRLDFKCYVCIKSHTHKHTPVTLLLFM